MLIAKKPKTAIFTLVAVMLIAVVSVGCTFTGAANNKDKPWTWMQNLSDEDIASATAWYGGSEAGPRLSESEITELISLLNSLEKDDFTENTQNAGITPEYGLAFECGGVSYFINQADAPSGSLEISYGGKQWWIDSSELNDFINGAFAKSDEQAFSVEVKVDSSIPQAVIDYATDYTRTQLLYYTDDLGYDITEALIVGLTQINTGTVGLDNGIDMYCLEYRLLAADPEVVMLVGGMRMDGAYITEWGSTGQPYLLLHWQDNDSETTWERICVTNTDNITQDYGTPEMLEQYGDMYTAAAMELYKKHESGGDTSPADAIDSLFASGDIALTLNLADTGAYNTYLAGKWYSGRFDVLLSGYEWTELEMPLTEPSSFWLTAVSADRAKSMTFWSSSGAGMVQYNDGNISTYWSASPANAYDESIAEDVRSVYDNLDVDYSRISFYLDGSAEAAAEAFVHSAYGSHMMSLAPGNMYGMSDYDVVQWEVRKVSENEDAVVGWFECAFTPWDLDSPGIWAGNTAEGTGEYEGKLTFFREFVLQRQEDGYWRCVDLGTGGASLPE